MRYVAVIMILYSAPMVLSGSLELGHDLLHYLATHHHAHIHDHTHHMHHGLRDHGYGEQHTHVENARSEESLPSLINFFLYMQVIESYLPERSLCAITPPADSTRLRSLDFPPLVPPPWSLVPFI
jgi:hypothetical protein